MENRKVILYISMSLDGFIATSDDDLSWLSIVNEEGEDYGYQAFNESVDTYIVGRKTYDVILQLTGGVFPQAEQHRCYVITKQDIPSQNGVTFYNKSLIELVETLKKESGKNIYCDGGSTIVKELMDHNLIDEYIISVIPIILGNGKRLFQGNTPQIDIKLVSSKAFKSGLVQMHYQKNEVAN